MRSQYGKRCSKYYESQERIVHFASLPEMWRANTLELLWQASKIVEWDYQPPPFKYPYKYRGAKLSDSYTPDFRVWYSNKNGKVWSVYEEIKRGYLDQKYATKIKRACQEHGDKLVLRLVWYGSPPRDGTTAAKQLDKIRPFLFDLQFEKVPK